MTAHDIYVSALQLLGYSYCEGAASGFPFLEDSLMLCNRALFDLTGKNAENTDEPLDISAIVADAAVYGTAMFMALYAGEKEKQNFLADIYNAKRKRCRSEIGCVKDVLP